MKLGEGSVGAGLPTLPLWAWLLRLAYLCPARHTSAAEVS
jgi:hypothetical protein